MSSSSSSFAQGQTPLHLPLIARSNKRKRSEDDDDSRASSSIGWNPEWDVDKPGSAADDDRSRRSDAVGSADALPQESPPSSIDAAISRSFHANKECSDDSVKGTEQDDSSQSSTDDDGDDDHTIDPQQLTNRPTSTRYEMLGAPTLLYRHAPSYADASQRPSPLTPHQINMALYLSKHPIGSWFKQGTERSRSETGETYPHSIQRYLPEQIKKVDVVNFVDAYNCANRARVRSLWADNHDELPAKAESTINNRAQYNLPMQYTNSRRGKRRYLPQQLEKERLKWLEWKLSRWDRRDAERSIRRQILQDYYMEREVKRLVSHWEKEEGVKGERRECKRRKKSVDLNITEFSWEANEPVMSQSCSSSHSSDDSSISSNWSDSTLSISTYYSKESAFHRWEEKTLVELDALDIPGDSEDEGSICENDVERRKVLSDWVFGDIDNYDVVGADGSVAIPQNHASNGPMGGEHHYSLNEIVRMIEKLKQQSQKSPTKEERLKAGADPFAPFRRQDVIEKDPTQHFSRFEIGGLSSYGNCLAVLKCTCEACSQLQVKNDSDQTPSKSLPSFFLVHPTGEFMSNVSISKLRLPRCSPSDPDGGHCEIDVGGRIHQISVCGNSQMTCREVCLVVRTPSYCSILIARPCDAKRNSSSGTTKCCNTINLTERTRIDLRSLLRMDQPSYFPFHVACDPKSYISFFTRPSFAILCLGQDGNKTNIHHVTLREEPQINRHELTSKLSDISIIEFDPHDRLALWAAARSVTMPKVAERFFKRGGANRGAIVEGLAGYGHSLYRINLRDDSVTFVWSPSHAEFIVEGVYSINGIMPDASREQIIWINSSSAGKMWALDIRYKSPKIVVSWSLPSLCDDLGAHCSITGVHGAGVLMNQHMSMSPTTPESSLPTMFSVKKDVNASTLNVYQFPSTMPRFQTRPLESAGFIAVPTSKYDFTSIARSSTFALPDTSEGIFNIGLSSLEVSTLTSLSGKKLSKLGHKTIPSHSTYVITMTSIGDIYCHTLLACDASEEPRARYFPGLPVGTISIPVPKKNGRNEEKSEDSCSEMIIELSNQFPVPSSAIATNISGFDCGVIRYEGKNRKADPGSKLHNNNYDGRVPFYPHRPCSFGRLKNSGQLESRDFDTLILSSNDDLKAEVDASINQDYLGNQVEITHPNSRFGVAIAKKFVSSQNQSTPATNASNIIQLESKHLLVAVQNVDGKVVSSREVKVKSKVGDVAPDMLRNLEAKFFKTEWNEEDAGLFAVKEEYSSIDGSASHTSL